ncbi:MAG: hypothetical protein ACK559_19295, partial [bacterium]
MQQRAEGVRRPVEQELHAELPRAGARAAVEVGGVAEQHLLGAGDPAEGLVGAEGPGAEAQGDRAGVGLQLLFVGLGRFKDLDRLVLVDEGRGDRRRGSRVPEGQLGG